MAGVLAAPAQATVRKGTASDPSGDTANAANDVLAGAVEADDATGRVTVAITTAAAPAAYSVAIVGTASGSGCTPVVQFGGSGSIAAYATRSGGKAATIQRDGNTVSMSATDPELDAPFDCAIVGTAADAAGNTVYDATAVFSLAAETPAPTPTPTATPVPTASPQPTVTNTPPVAVPKTAKLSAALGAPPSTIKRNRTITLKLTLANDGAKSTSAGTVTIASAKGLSAARRKVKVSKLKPAAKRTLKLKVKLTRAKATLKVTARAGKLKATTSLVLKVGKAKKLPQPTTKKSPIVGTYWWRTVTHVDYAWDNRALYFVDDKTVYSGFPKGGLPAACTTAPAEPSEEIDTREGCLPYTYDEKTGALTIAGVVGSYKPGGKLTLDGNDYDAMQVAAAGARPGYNELRHWAFQGFCGLITGCTVTKDYFTLTPAGEFVLSHSFTSTMGDPGLGPYTAVGSYPPDERGVYEVLPGGKIRLAFADGSVREETFAITSDGVMLGEDNFYPDSD